MKSEIRSISWFLCLPIVSNLQDWFMINTLIKTVDVEITNNQFEASCSQIINIAQLSSSEEGRFIYYLLFNINKNYSCYNHFWSSYAIVLYKNATLLFKDLNLSSILLESAWNKNVRKLNRNLKHLVLCVVHLKLLNLRTFYVRFYY